MFTSRMRGITPEKNYFFIRLKSKKILSAILDEFFPKIVNIWSKWYSIWKCQCGGGEGNFMEDQYRVFRFSCPAADSGILEIELLYYSDQFGCHMSQGKWIWPKSIACPRSQKKW